jgi:hypothetical protein
MSWTSSTANVFIDPFSSFTEQGKITALQTDLTATLADTNELQAEWVDGGRLDLILDAIPDLVWSGTEGVTVAAVASVLDGMILDSKFSTAALSEVWSTIGAEPTAIPAAAVTMLAKIGLLYALARNKLITDVDGITLRNDADTADIGSATHEELAGTYTRNKFS